MAKRFNKVFKARADFPIEEKERWVVHQGNRVVEKWYVNWVKQGDKSTLANIEITCFEEDEYEAFN